MTALGETPQTDIEWEGRARMAGARLAGQQRANARLAAAEERLAAALARRAPRSGTTGAAQDLAWDDYYRALAWRDLAARMARSVELDDVDRQALERRGVTAAR